MSAQEKQSKKLQCYLCGAFDPKTRDHIPPRGFFPEPRPTNLITLPCCERCNNSCSKDDEAMRVWLSSGMGHTPAAEWIIENKVFPGTFTRSPAFRSEVLSRMEDTIITNEDGEQIEAVKFSMNRERVESFVVRVAKGLQKTYFPNLDASRDTWRGLHVGTRLDDLAKIEPLRDGLPHYDYRGDGVIQYRFGFTKELSTGIWLLVFYGTAIFIVTHRREDRNKLSDIEGE
ncbi:MAG TPA: hypothetical protein PLB55_08640 [Prosthecobacter sp.]|nr:hypothetical protein [Prosthecobacter sp.]